MSSMELSNSLRGGLLGFSLLDRCPLTGVSVSLGTALRGGGIGTVLVTSIRGLSLCNVRFVGSSLTASFRLFTRTRASVKGGGRICIALNG